MRCMREKSGKMLLIQRKRKTSTVGVIASCMV